MSLDWSPLPGCIPEEQTEDHTGERGHGGRQLPQPSDMMCQWVRTSRSDEDCGRDITPINRCDEECPSSTSGSDAVCGSS